MTQPGASFLPWDSTQSFLWPEAKSIRRQHWAATGTAMTKVPTRVSSSRPVGSSGCPRWQSGQPGTEAPALGRTLPKLGLPIHPKGPVRPRLRASSGRWLRPSSGTTSSRQRPALVLLRRAAMPLPPTLPQRHPLCLLFLRGCSPRHHPQGAFPHVAAWLSGLLHLPHLHGLGRPPNTGPVQEVRLL